MLDFQEFMLNRTDKKSLHIRTILPGILISIVLVIVGITIWLVYDQHQKDNNLNDVQVVVRRVSSLAILPQNETPALATVTDKSKLQTPFLQQADNGDRILIYEKAKKVIIYRPSINKIVDIGPVDIAPAKTNSIE